MDKTCRVHSMLILLLSLCVSNMNCTTHIESFQNFRTHTIDAWAFQSFQIFSALKWMAHRPVEKSFSKFQSPSGCSLKLPSQFMNNVKSSEYNLMWNANIGRCIEHEVDCWASSFSDVDHYRLESVVLLMLRLLLPYFWNFRFKFVADFNFTFKVLPFFCVHPL